MFFRVLSFVAAVLAMHAAGSLDGAGNETASLFLAGSSSIDMSPARGFLAPARRLAIVGCSEAAHMLVTAVENSLGGPERDFMESRLPIIEARLGELIASMPKNRYGNLNPVGVRYLMHRFFVQTHGWHVKGFDPAGGAWNASSPTKAIGDLLPAHVQALFEEQLASRGYSLGELAVLAATLETLVHHEARDLLRGIYATLNVPLTGWVAVEQADELLDAHMATFIMGKSLWPTGSRRITARALRQRIKTIITIYPNWPVTQAWLRKMRQAVLGERSQFNFHDVASVIDEVGDQYGAYQDGECDSLKRDLIALEESKSIGCVRLSDFYGSGEWQFNEHPDYLRALGALEESSPKDPHVLTANYIASSGNCVANSHFYSVCCRDHCGELHDHVAHAIGAPTATAEQVIQSLSELSGEVSPFHQELLSDIAGHSLGGRVPLHGRLFAEWLHQLRPQDCPFPHLAGAVHDDPVSEYEVSGRSSVIGKAEKTQLLAQTPPSPEGSLRKSEGGVTSGKASCVPWQPQEELVIVDDSAEDPSPLSISAVCLFAVLSLLVVLRRLVGTLRSDLARLDRYPKEQLQI